MARSAAARSISPIKSTHGVRLAGSAPRIGQSVAGLFDDFSTSLADAERRLLLGDDVGDDLVERRRWSIADEALQLRHIGNTPGHVFEAGAVDLLVGELLDDRRAARGL